MRGAVFLMVFAFCKGNWFVVIALKVWKTFLAPPENGPRNPRTSDPTKCINAGPQKFKTMAPKIFRLWLQHFCDHRQIFLVIMIAHSKFPKEI